ncbi:AraC family transcriptional regulator [Pyxidicoccus parkwayensis]|uniref:AraC family transcriptional regulator n=1 Tax=Pyxidicoccus parkwayensis TaxID=2813578 RepID=A0ABX7PDE6_9BACT|nr:AraC family transcriptional regulator [Pyxidicoccus parkwaysis]
MRSFLVISGDAEGAFVRLPDGHADLVLRFSPSYEGVYAIGTRLSVLRKPVEAVPPQTIIVRFKPGGAYPFFGVPMSELTERVVSLDTLWGAEGARLRQRLADAASVTERRHLLESTLTERLRRGDVFEPAGAPVVRRAVRLITEASELPRVEGLARGLGISPRHLRRAFEDVVGMGPKEFARVVRFQRAVRASARASAPDWGAIAAATGYYDQSHLITEFKALTGLTPRALLKPLSATPSETSSPMR